MSPSSILAEKVEKLLLITMDESPERFFKLMLALDTSNSMEFFYCAFANAYFFACSLFLLQYQQQQASKMKGRTMNENAVIIDIIIEIMIVVLPGVELSGMINPKNRDSRILINAHQ